MAFTAFRVVLSERLFPLFLRNGLFALVEFKFVSRHPVYPSSSLDVVNGLSHIRGHRVLLPALHIRRLTEALTTFLVLSLLALSRFLAPIPPLLYVPGGRVRDRANRGGLDDCLRYVGQSNRTTLRREEWFPVVPVRSYFQFPVVRLYGGAVVCAIQHELPLCVVRFFG